MKIHLGTALTYITNPVNNDTIHYCSIHNDGSSSTKTTEEKELYIAALENSITKLGLINRKEREVTFRHDNFDFIITKKYTFVLNKSY